MRRMTLATFAGWSLLSATVAMPAMATTEAIPLCFGQTPTIVGAEGDDDGLANPILEGTEGADVIVGLGGNDWIDGNGGDDRICGGAGLDHIDAHEDASAGNDRIAGNGGPDCAIGSWSATEAGLDDVIRGGAQNDNCLTGGPGDDLVIGGAGIDFLNGNAGDDVLRGGAGDDRLDDRFSGVGEVGTDTDLLFGHGGNDRLVADDGDVLDTLYGGDGTNFCESDAGDAIVRCEPLT